MENQALTPKPDIKLVNEAYRLRTTDKIKSFLTLENYAARGSLSSLIYISDMFWRGVPLTDVVERAKHWNAVAREVNLGEASYRFGYGFYKLGDYESAFEAFSWGAERGYAPSTYRLASMYFFGKHVKVDLAKAKDLLEEAAKKGNVFAKKLLAHILLTKNFGIVGKIKAIKIWFTLSYYQMEWIVKSLKGTPTDERYFH